MSDLASPLSKDTSAPIGNSLTITAAAQALRDQKVTSVELTSACLKAIKATQSSLGAFVTVCEDTALEAADQADRELEAGQDLGRLHGIPLAIKDIISTREAPTSANSRVLDPSWGAGQDAPVVSRLRAAGSVVLGKSTTSEFAIGPPDAEKGFPIPRNPWNTEHTASSSSSGTGIAVAAGLALGGLGTDTGGSVRGPASANGHTGLKVTFGRVPKNGVVPLAYSLDSVGPMARSAMDCAFLLEVIAGHDPGDPHASTADVPMYSSALDGSVEGLRVGLPMPYFFDSEELDAETRSAVLTFAQKLGEIGASVQETVVPYAKEAKDANALILTAEAFAYHRNNLVNRWDDYGRFTRPTLARGAFTTAGDYTQAQRFRSWFCRQLATVFGSFDVLVTPASLGPAERTADMNLERRFSTPSFSGQWNLAGLPAVVFPCGRSTSGLPLAVQVVGKPFAEETVLRVADAYQRLTDWHLQRPLIAELNGV